MADIMAQQAGFEGRGAMTARSGSGEGGPNNSLSRQTINTAAAVVGAGGGRLQARDAQISRPSDVRPALIEWLTQSQSLQDKLFGFIEEKTTVDREKVR